MRFAQESRVWEKLIRARGQDGERLVSISESIELDLSAPCTVLGGLNGAGKSRVLRQIHDRLGDGSLFIDLHHLVEQAMMVLRTREDLQEMSEEFAAVGPSPDRLEDVQRVVGREYDRLDWFALELEPSDSRIADRFCWAGSQPVVPFFNASYAGQDFTSREMGLGEFSVHFLFWILELYRERDDLVLLLDEPDAYLPPLGSESLLVRLLRICRERGWSVVLSTHSEELVSQAARHDSFVLLRMDEKGDTVAFHSKLYPHAPEAVLARTQLKSVFFCEDESAFYLTRALLSATDRAMSRSTSIIWGNGEGYLGVLKDALPRPPRPDISFLYVFDGDQRDNETLLASEKWECVFLPTSDDPDTLFKQLGKSHGTLSAKLGISADELGATLDRVEGADPHDWVNCLSVAHGRQHVMESLADLWCFQNPAAVTDFYESLTGL